MGDVILTFPDFPDGTTASGVEVINNFDDMLAKVNGALDDDNLANAGITASDKLKDATITGSKMAASSVDANAIAWAQASNGVRGWRTPGYAGANGNRLIRVEKQITLAAVTTEQSIAIDWSASDSPDGAITFTSAPTVVGVQFKELTETAANQSIAGTPAATLKYLVVVSITTTGCTVLCRFSAAPAAVASVLSMVVLGAA